MEPALLKWQPRPPPPDPAHEKYDKNPPLQMPSDRYRELEAARFMGCVAGWDALPEGRKVELIAHHQEYIMRQGYQGERWLREAAAPGQNEVAAMGARVRKMREDAVKRMQKAKG